MRRYHYIRIRRIDTEARYSRDEQTKRDRTCFSCCEMRSSGAIMKSVGSNNEQEVCVPVASDNDLMTARREGREMARQLGFSACEGTLVATAISELTRNIFTYARHGKIHIRPINNSTRRGITVVASDLGPGIADTRLAAQAGYSTCGGRGLGLPGVRRIMDEFDISSRPGRGTTVTATKWKRP